MTNGEIVSSDFSENAGEGIPEGLVKIGKVVCYNGTPDFSRVNVTLDPLFDVKPGQFLAVWHGRRKSFFLTVIQVSNCSEINPNEDPTLSVARERLGLNSGYAEEGVSTRIYRMAFCETMDEYEVEFDAEKGCEIKSTRSPQNLSRSGDPVVILPAELSYAVIGCLPDPSSGAYVGRTYGPDSVDVTLKPEIFQMHIGIFGNPGQGKSYSAGVMLEEAFNWDIPTLVLDVNGEMAKTAQSIGGLVITLPDSKKFGLSLNLLTPPELVSVTPNVRPNTQYAELIELAHDQLRTDPSGRPISFDMLKTRVEKLGSDLNITGTSVRAAISRLSALEKDPLIGTNFDFIENLKKHKQVVLDCRFLSLRQTQLIAAAAARVLQKYGRDMARKAVEENDDTASKWFSIFFVDEAHAIVPNDEDIVSTQVLYELARMGRHVRTGLILSSQSPSDLDVSVLKRLQTRFVFALERDQLRAIGGITADMSEEIIHQLPKLPRGVCAVSGSKEIIKHGFLLEVRERKTPVGGATPPVFANRRKGSL